MTKVPLGQDGIKAFRALMESKEDLSLIELRMLILILETLKISSSQKEDMEEFSSVIAQLEPLIKQELEFRSRDTQGTV